MHGSFQLWPNFWTSLAAGLVAGIAIFAGGYYLPQIRAWQLHRDAYSFWGRAVTGSDLVVCYGALQLKRQECPDFPYEKRQHDDIVRSLKGPFEDVVGAVEIRATSYLMQALAVHRKDPVDTIADRSAFDNLQRTFVSLGSGGSNELTKLVLEKDSSNCFYFKGVEKDGITRFTIVDKETGEEWGGPEIVATSAKRKDHGLIVKLRNEWSPQHFIFICAGLGEYGTSGAAWYLGTKWEQLQKQYQDKPFSALVEVELRSDTSAQLVGSYPSGP